MKQSRIRKQSAMMVGSTNIKKVQHFESNKSKVKVFKPRRVIINLL